MSDLILSIMQYGFLAQQKYILFSEPHRGKGHENYCWEDTCTWCRLRLLPGPYTTPFSGAQSL